MLGYLFQNEGATLTPKIEGCLRRMYAQERQDARKHIEGIIPVLKGVPAPVSYNQGNLGCKVITAAIVGITIYTIMTSDHQN